MPHVGDVGEGRGRMIKALRKTVGNSDEKRYDTRRTMDDKI